MTTPEATAAVADRRTTVDDMRAQVRDVTTGAETIAREINEGHRGAERVMSIISAFLRQEGRTPDELGGRPGDEETARGQADKAKKDVLKVLIAAKEAPAKIPLPVTRRDGTPVATEVRGLARNVINELGKHLSYGDVTEQTAPYLHTLVYKLLNGDIANNDGLSEAYKSLMLLNYVSPEVYKDLGDALKAAAVTNGMPEAEADTKFKIAEAAAPSSRSDSKLSNEERVQKRRELEDLTTKIRSALDENLMHAEAVNRLTAKEQAVVRRFLMDQDDIPPDELVGSFRRLGLDPADIGHFRDLHNQVFGGEENEPLRMPAFLTDRTLQNRLQEAWVDFDIDKLMKDPQFVTRNEHNEPVFTEKGRKAYKKMITKYYYYALEKVHDNRSNMFQNSMSEQEQYYVQGLKGVIRDSTEKLAKTFAHDKNTLDFLRDASNRYQASIMSYAQIFHDLPLYARDAASFQKWGEFIGYLFPSELAEVFDPDDPTMEIARRDIAMYLRQRVANNGNKIPNDLFSGEYSKKDVTYSQKDQATIRDRLKRRLQSLYPDRKIEDWELSRAVTYGMGIGISTLIDPEVIGSADPHVDANFKGIYPLAGVLFAKHNFGLGRGFPGSGAFPHLAAMDVELFPEQRGLISRLIKRKKWVPRKFHEWAISQQAKYGEQVLDQMLDRKPKGEHGIISRQGQYMELLNMINLPASLMSRAGWRVSPQNGVLTGALNSGVYYDGEKQDMAASICPTCDEGGWGNKQWKRYYDTAMRLFGTSATWWWANDRIKNELKRYLAIEEGYDRMVAEWEKYWPERPNFDPTENSTTFNRKFNLEFNGHKQALNFMEVRQIRTYEVRADLLHRYMQRNPGDFLSLLSQTCPELLDFDTNFFDSEDNIRRSYEAKHKSKKDVEAAIYNRNKLLSRWGNENFAQLAEIHNWLVRMDYDDATRGYKERNNGDGVGILTKIKTEKGLADNKAAFAYLVEQSGNAFEKLWRDKETRTDGKPGRSREYVTLADFSDETVGRALLGEGGLMPMLRIDDAHYQEYFGGFGEERHGHHAEFTLGREHLFFRMAEIWTLKNNDIDPFAADVNHFALYENIGQVGEDVNKRVLGDASAAQKMIEGVGKLDTLLQHAAQSGNLEEIYKLHSTIYSTLKGTMSAEYAHRANYILASLVAKFFYEHSELRGPLRSMWFIRPILEWRMGGKNVSLSKLLTHRFAYSMDENALREYFNHLSYKLEVLPHEGIWSNIQLMQEFDATHEQFVFDNAPNYIFTLLFFILMSALKKGIEELEGKKK